MQRRDFLKSTVAVAVAAELGMGKAEAKVPAHNWGNYNLEGSSARPGCLEMPDYLKQVFDLAKKNNKRIGLRVQMCAPDYAHDAALPDFVLEKVPES
jgi:hypothetical protein